LYFFGKFKKTSKIKFSLNSQLIILKINSWIILYEINGDTSQFLEIKKVYQVNNSVTFSEEPIGSEESLNQMVEALGITIDRRPKGRPHKRGK